MKLTAGRTYWDATNRNPPRYPRLRRNVRCDVAVIGAGITGAFVAHALVKSGLNVVVVDKRAVARGSTSASTALLLYETDTSLAELSRRHGREAATRAYTLGRRAIREIATIVRHLRLDCGFQPKQCLYLASDARGLVQLRGEFRRRRRAGFPVELLYSRELHRRFGLRFPGAIYAPGSAQVDALRLAEKLLAHDVRHGRLRVFTHSQIVAAESGKDGVRLRTPSRRTIDAKHVVIATGYEAAPFLATNLVKLHSSYVIASEPLPPKSLWADRCLIWETARPYLYLRTTPDGRVLIGGEDEPFADPARRDAKLPAKMKKLARRFRRLFPGVAFRTAFGWAGTFGESQDGLPYIGAMPGSPRVLYALGYGGNGITFSQIAAKLLAQVCHGRAPRDLQLFRFDRSQSRRGSARRARRAENGSIRAAAR